MLNEDYLKVKIKNWLCREKEKILELPIPGYSDIKTREIICDDKLFIPIPWSRIPQKEEKNNKTLVAQIINTLLFNKEKLILLGTPGQGKSTVLKKVFVKLVDRYISDKINQIPVYISFHDLFDLKKYNDSEENSGKNISFFREIFNSSGNNFPFSCSETKALSLNKDIIYLLDGLDEITTELNQKSINENMKNIVFDFFSILTCRTEFYNTFLSGNEITRQYKNKIYISELKYNNILKKYISDFCKEKNIPYDDISDLLDNNSNIKELIVCPLWLMMFLDICTDRNYIDRVRSFKTRGIAELYGLYIEKYLNNEAPKSGYSWEEKDRRMKKLSWYMYDKNESNSLAYSTYQSSRINSDGIKKALQDSNGNLDPEIVQDVLHHTLLVGARYKKTENNLSSDFFYFIHYSFQEYYTALCIFENMNSDYESTKDAIKKLIPFEIAKFLKDMLDNNSSINDKERIMKNLVKVYQDFNNEKKLNSILRQHASYYLAYLKTDKAKDFLLENYNNEKDKWVKRSMMVGLANFWGRTDIMEKYIGLLHEDPETLKINLLYHLVYYGDLPLEEMFSNKKVESNNYSRTIKAIIRHLENKKYKNSWMLDIFTLNQLIEKSVKKSIFGNNEYKKILRIFLQKRINLQFKKLLSDEIKAMKNILGKGENP